MLNKTAKINLTEYSHGSGCGCKITPTVLDEILQTNYALSDKNLLVGNASKDDAAVYALDETTAIISTTDFFMPIVDDAFTFGQIAATNAISDIFAMGGTPLLAIAIFGWPLDKLPLNVGRKVVEGGRQACKAVGIKVAGGHSIDAPEPIFGLAVTGKVKIANLKRNDTAKAENLLFLTKPLGVGILSTAQKKKLISPSHREIVERIMCVPNKIGAAFAKIPGVSAMTDVTGFGLAGHLLEICEGRNLRAEVYYDKLPLLDGVYEYLTKGCSPGGATRNYKSYGDKISDVSLEQRAILCDPQTSGGLLVVLDKEATGEFEKICEDFKLELEPIGKLYSPQTNTQTIKII